MPSSPNRLTQSRFKLLLDALGECIQEYMDLCQSRALPTIRLYRQALSRSSTTEAQELLTDLEGMFMIPEQDLWKIISLYQRELAHWEHTHKRNDWLRRRRAEGGGNRSGDRTGRETGRETRRETRSETISQPIPAPLDYNQLSLSALYDIQAKLHPDIDPELDLAITTKEAYQRSTTPRPIDPETGKTIFFQSDDLTIFDSGQEEFDPDKAFGAEADAPGDTTPR